MKVANEHRSRYESTMARFWRKVKFKILMREQYVYQLSFPSGVRAGDFESENVAERKGGKASPAKFRVDGPVQERAKSWIQDLSGVVVISGRFLYRACWF
jgi:hypothetical protein